MKFNDFIVSEEKVRLDPKCWTGKKIGNPKTKVKGGVRVNNCVPAESVEEAANPAQQAAIAIAKKKKAGVDEAAPPGAKAERMVKHIKKGYAKDGKLSDKEKSIAYATAWKAHNKGVTEAMRPIPVDDQGNRIPDRMPSNEPKRPFGQPGDAKSSSQGVVTHTPTGIVHRSNHGDVTPRPRAVPEDASPDYIWIQGDFDGDTATTGSKQGSWRDQQTTQVELTRGRMSNVRPLSGPPPEGGKTIKQAQIPLTLDAGNQKFSTTGVDLQLTVAPNGYISQGGVGRVRGTAVVKIMRPGNVAEGTQQVDSLVTDALKIMQGSEASDAVAALKTVLGDREYNSRRGYYNFYVRQLLDMSGQQGMAEGAQDFNKIKTSYDQASRMFSGEETQGFTIEVLLPNEATFKKIQDTFEMLKNQIGEYLIEKDDSIEGNGIGVVITSPLKQGGQNAQRSYNQILGLIQKSRGQFNKSTGVTIYKQTQGMAEGGYPEVDHMSGNRGIGLDSAKPRDTYIKTFHASKEKEAQEFAKKNGYIVKKHVYPKSANNSQPHEFQVHKNEQGVAEGMSGQVVFSGTGADGGKYEIIQSGPTDFMIHANGRHIDTYGSLQRAMSVLKNEVPGLTKGVAEAVTPASVSKVLRLIQRHHSDWFDTYGMGEVEDTVVDMAEMGQFRGTSAAVALKLVGDELESMYGQQGVAEGLELNAMRKAAGLPVVEGRMLDESGETLSHIMDRFKHEVDEFEKGGDLDNDLYYALFDYYSDHGEIPYGIAKGRDGDPFEWVTDRLDRELGTGNHAPRVSEADALNTFEVMSGFDAPVAEGSCNMTAEGEYCPEHALAECGMYEMGTVAGSVAPVIGEEQLDEFDIDALNQIASHPMAGTLAAAGGAAIGATVGKGIEKTVNYFQKKKQDKAYDNLKQQQQAGVAESKSDDALLARIKSLALIK